MPNDLAMIPDDEIARKYLELNSISELAKYYEVSPSTARNWVNGTTRPGIRAELAQTKFDYLEQTATLLLQGAQKAVSNCTRLMDSDDEKVSLRASETMMLILDKLHATMFKGDAKAEAAEQYHRMAVQFMSKVKSVLKDDQWVALNKHIENQTKEILGDEDGLDAKDRNAVKEVKNVG